ncbi:hypothetical protein XELAEV_18031400mg [Xenopus laevis]|uniref:Uncharacterized protein n=1 Tax=Xenopus laevis TaxID=8355 RepID=A0A974HFM6_XENLA|nr:hypothetical protein XELAEV_18031400mg [Xenopus laevis]
MHYYILQSKNSGVAIITYTISIVMSAESFNHIPVSRVMYKRYASITRGGGGGTQFQYNTIGFPLGKRGGMLNPSI